MRVQLVRVLRGIEANVFASHHLIQGKPRGLNKQWARETFLTGFILAAGSPKAAEKIHSLFCPFMFEKGQNKELILSAALGLSGSVDKFFFVFLHLWF